MAAFDFQKEMMNLESGGKSMFNEAALKMMRINVLQQQINICQLNALAYNVELGKYNYEVIFKALIQLFQECAPRLKGKEKEEGMDLKKQISTILKTKPIHEVRYNTSSNNPDKNVIHFNKKSWEEAEDLLFEFEMRIRSYLDKSGLSVPTEDSPLESAYR